MKKCYSHDILILYNYINNILVVIVEEVKMLKDEVYIRQA
jgi:hypothetical protein